MSGEPTTNRPKPRKANWTQLLHDYVEKYRNAPFEWGRNDCLTFALRWERLVSESSVFLDAIFVYSNEAEANALMCEHQVYDAFEVCDLRLDRLIPTMAQRGDIIGHTIRRQPALGVCVGKHFVVPSGKSLKFQPMQKAECAWRV